MCRDVVRGFGGTSKCNTVTVQRKIVVRHCQMDADGATTVRLRDEAGEVGMKCWGGADHLCLYQVDAYEPREQYERERSKLRAQ